MHGVRLLSLALVLLAHASCGYHLVGKGAFLPEYVHTIGVPTFQNRTSRFALEQKVTDAVVRELSRRGNFDVVARDSNVDAVLAGTITSFTTVPVGFGPDGNANRYQILMSAQVALLDARARKVIYQNDTFTYRDDYDIDLGGALTGNLDRIFDREPEAVDRVAREFAESMVITMLEGF